MDMPSYETAAAEALDKPAFSNGSEHDAWSARWCDRCRHYDDCPLLLVMLDEQTPAQWVQDVPGSLGRQYRCTQFSPAD
jgi:hypothetical protein